MGDPRFSIIPAGAVLDPRIEPRDLQVLCLFGKHTDRKGWCRRSQVAMAKEIGCARSTVQASIDRLITAGWLEKRAAADLHTPGVRDSAHEYRVVLDTPDDPQDVAGRVPTDRHSPAGPVSAPPADPYVGTYVNVPLSNDETPQPPSSGGPSFADLWKIWPEEHRGRWDNADGAFRNLRPGDQTVALSAAPLAVKALGRRKGRFPALVRYLRSRTFAEFDGGPDIDADGAFIITPKRPEWGPWLGWLRNKHGQRGVDSIVKTGFFLPETRWPPGHMADAEREHAT